MEWSDSEKKTPESTKFRCAIILLLIPTEIEVNRCLGEVRSVKTHACEIGQGYSKPYAICI